MFERKDPGNSREVEAFQKSFKRGLEGRNSHKSSWAWLTELADPSRTKEVERAEVEGFKRGVEAREIQKTLEQGQTHEPATQEPAWPLLAALGIGYIRFVEIGASLMLAVTGALALLAGLVGGDPSAFERCQSNHAATFLC